MKKKKSTRRFRATFLHRRRWWVAWTDDLPGALTQGKTLKEARENLKDAIRLMLEPVGEDELPASSTELVQEVIHL
jgi:predicted RNase H-like HicB family nuclease